MIEERIVTGLMSILEDGQINLREDIVILRNGVEVTRLYHRRVIEPGSDVSKESGKIKAISQIIWTPQVVTEFRRKRQEVLDKL